jgi:2EXR family
MTKATPSVPIHPSSSTASWMDPSHVFTLFTKLPSELRIKIWQRAFPAPRVVPVRFHRGQYTSNSAPLSLLHASSESRSVLLSTYTKLILSPKYDSVVFINFDVDTIFFDNLDCSPDGDLSLDLARSPHSDRILSCAIDSQVWEVLRVFKYDPLSEVTMMPNLRTIALVMLRDHDTGESRRLKADKYGRENIFIRMESTAVETEMMHVQGYVDNLRADLKHALDQRRVGHVPVVQMWLW